jgi:hypothetical protein
MKYTYFSILAELIDMGLYVYIDYYKIEGKKMSDPKKRNLEEAFTPNKLVGPNIVDFPFHCNNKNIDRAIISSISPLYKDQLALIQTEGKNYSNVKKVGGV